MSDKKELGEMGEELAAAHLADAGFRIIHRNWKWGKNEIDIIAENRDFIVFTEVKTRTEDFRIDPALAVDRNKQRAIIFAAEGYLRTHRIDKESRFDIITVIKTDETFTIDHIEDAFYPTLR